MIAERRQTIAVIGVGVIATVEATAGFAFFVQPFNDNQYGEAGLTVRNVIVGLIVAGVAVALTIALAGQGSAPSTWRALLIAAVIPR